MIKSTNKAKRQNWNTQTARDVPPTTCPNQLGTDGLSTHMDQAFAQNALQSSRRCHHQHHHHHHHDFYPHIGTSPEMHFNTYVNIPRNKVLMIFTTHPYLVQNAYCEGRTCSKPDIQNSSNYRLKTIFNIDRVKSAHRLFNPIPSP